MSNLPSIDDLLAKYKSKQESYNPKEFNTVIRHNSLDKMRFEDMRHDYNTLNEEDNFSKFKGTEKQLKTFNDLQLDTFNSFYSANPLFRDDKELSTYSKRFNKSIMKKVHESDEFKVIKDITNGDDFASIEATKSLLDNISENLDSYLEDVTGKKEALDVLDKKKQELDVKRKEIADQLNDMEQKDKEGKLTSGQKEQMIKSIQSADKKADFLQKQVNAIEENIILASKDANTSEKLEKDITVALKTTLDKVNEVKNTVGAWGTEKTKEYPIEQKKELVDRVKKSKKLTEISKILGRYRQIVSKSLQDNFEYGLGEIYDIETGCDLTRLVPSELAMLCVDEMEDTFMDKYINSELQQFVLREPIPQGRGNIICCLDESGSMMGGQEYWSKAVAVALADEALHSRRNFGCIHFSSHAEIQSVTPDNFDERTLIDIAEKFLGGGTNFEVALTEAVKLLDKPEYANADIVFVTDGENQIPQSFLDSFLKLKAEKKFRVIGVLMDMGSGYCSDATLKQFCNQVYKTSELDQDTIAENIFNAVK